MTTRRIILPAPGKPITMSFAGIVAAHRADANDLIVVKAASSKAARLAFKPHDPDFVFAVAATESIILEFTTTE